MDEELINLPLFTVEEIPQMHPSVEAVEIIPYKVISHKTKTSLDDFFPEQRYDKKIQKAKEILGPLCNAFTSDQLTDIVTEIQYLCESWLDDYERNVFDGKTLKELLHERGGI